MKKLETRKLITQLYQSGIVLSVANGKLRSEAPPEAMTDEVKRTIVQNKSVLVAYLSDELKRPAASVKIVAADKVSVEFPLTPTQKQFWFIDSLNNGSAHYNLVGMLQVTGKFDRDLAEQAFQYVIARHEPLHTSFHSKDESVFQRLNTPDWFLNSFDFQHMSKEAQEEEIYRLREQEIEYVFNLETAPLFRATYIRQSNEFGTLLCNLHHIAGDGWSVQILLKEFIQTYSKLVNGEEPNLDTLPIRYSDYVKFLSERSEQISFQNQLSYWKTQLSGLPVVHDFPLDYPRSVHQQFDGAVISKELSSELAEKLKELAKNKACSLFVLLHAIFSCLLYKNTGNQEVVVGTPFAGRDEEELQGLIGLFINTLVLRTECNKEDEFTAFLKHVQSINLQAQSNNQITISELVESLGVKRDSSFAPLFQILYSMNNTQQTELSCSAFNMDFLPENKVKTKAEITLDATPTDESIILRCEYNTALFNAETIERLLSQFSFLASQIVENPTIKIADLALLNIQETEQLIAEMSGPVIDYEDDKLVHNFISEAATKYPQRTALKFASNEICYAEFNRRTDELAAYLISTNKQNSKTVGVLIERSIEMVIAMVGILKAGMHYVPVDPAYPLNRINYVLEHAGVYTIIVSKNTSSIVPKSRDFSLCLVDAFSEKELDVFQPVANDGTITSRSPAYIIYTSGSTGKPKGVVVTHQNVVNFFTSLNNRFGNTEHPTRWLAVTSISFDISVLEILWNLAQGNEVVLMPDRPSSVSVENNPSELDFSLFYFAAEEAKQAGTKYDLLLNGAKFADENDLSAVWIPERHFSSFGDQFPNPSVAAAAVAATTQHIKIRSGSVVIPLHDVIRVAEEWSMVDNLSRGRVEMSLASGWHPNDFVLMPDDYSQRHAKMNQQIVDLKSLWRGESIRRINGVGNEIDIKVHPSPVQEQLTTWVTAAGAPQTFEYAGKSGANVLTHLLGQTPKMLAEKIAVYRNARAEAGLDPDAGKVALMLHTFIGEETEQVQRIVEKPFKQYLAHSINLLSPMAKDAGLDLENDRDAIIEMGYERFYRTSGLFGTVDECMQLLKEVHDIGVNEIACLIDFGIETEIAIQHLPFICKLKEQFSQFRAQQQFLRSTLRENWSPQSEIVNNNISHLQCTPSFLSGWEKEDVGKVVLANLDVLCVGGEPMPTDMPDKILPSLGGILYNMYGPTETTVWSSIREITDQNTNIGDVIANTQFYVVDESDQIVPPGVIGELLIGGDGVTQGYHQQPELTQERFEMFSFMENHTNRVYRTGDYVRYLGNQTFQFVGRKDEQVKINGFRVELGEIELFFNSLKAVDKTVAVVNSEAGGQPSIVVYVKGNADIDHGVLDEDYLRLEAQAQLPAYMVPSTIISVTAFPLTPNGKVDKRALPEPHYSLSQEYVAPSSAVELSLAQSWQEVLEMSQPISRHDDFFQLGGHSLLAITLQGRIHKQFGKRLGIDVLFTHSRLKDMAAQLEECTVQHSLPVLDSEETPETVEAGINQKSLWIAEKLNKNSALYNMVSMVHIEGEVEYKRLLKTLQLVEYKHDAFRMSFDDAGTEIILNDQGSMLTEITQIDISSNSKKEQSEYLQELSSVMSLHQFDMRHGPLWIVTLVKTGQQHYTLVLNIHHICIDGWSKRLWLDDIQNIYAALESDTELTVKTKEGAQYRDFAFWQRKLVQDGHLDYQLDYWLQKLAGISGFNNLPVDYAYPEKQSFAGAKHEFVIDGDALESIRQASSKHGVSLYMMMVAAFNVLLQIETEQNDIVIGTDVSGRMHEDLEDIIGFFTNQIVLRNNVATEASLAQNLQSVKASTIEAFAHQDVPFDLLVRKLSLPRSPKYSPLFQAKIFMDHAPDYQNKASEWNMFVEEIENQPARCELTLGLIEYPDKLQAMFVYATSLFEPSTISRFAKRFNYIVAEMCYAPSTTIESLISKMKEHENKALKENKQALLNKRVAGIKRRERRQAATTEKA